jgi:shikimate dehydrogenase
VGRHVHARLFGVLGDPVEHSLSPAMHNAAFAALGLPHLYLRYRVQPDALPAALAEARCLNMGGLNLTIPLKEAVLPHVDRLTPEARAIGAVNTLVFRRDGILGDNTDGRGFVTSLAGHVRVRGARAVLIGAGGAARAVAVALVRGGCHRLTLANRTGARAEALADRLRHLGPASIDVVPLDHLARGDALEGAAVVVNTTSAGLRGAVLPVRHAASPVRCLFVDLVYAARPTAFMAAARRAHRRALDGSGMLLHQGALAFETWTARRAPLTVMARALAEAGLPLTRPRRSPNVRRARPEVR